ncbi:MAG: DUF4387 domain-containing protein [Desulfovibrio sp.]|jgi:hypothetical protein|nr:DUF4387 domain-containing protein [Desulfovibrio sp.]
MQYTLRDVASVIRSKNAGPYELTFDVIFKDFALYEKARAAEILTKERFAALYGISVGDVIALIWFDPAKAVKVTIARPMVSGHLGESDVYGAQQHAPLINFAFSL